MLKNWLSLASASWQLGAEAALVVPLRLARLARGGDAAAAEARLMVAEKLEAHGSLWQAWREGDLGEGPVAQADGAMRHYLGYVRANRLRLMGSDCGAEEASDLTHTSSPLT